MTSSKLSPAAQIVWDAAWQLSPVNCKSHEDRRRQQIAAALRAAADQVVPFNDEMSVLARSLREIRLELLSIANELEGQGNG